MKHDELDEGIIEQKVNLKKTQRKFIVIDLTVAFVLFSLSWLAVFFDINPTFFTIT